MKGALSRSRFFLSIISVSFSRTCICVRVRAFSMIFSAPFLAEADTEFKISCSLIVEYHNSRFPMAANFFIFSRYDLTDAITASLHKSSSAPRKRPDATILATRRFKSHSQGPGNVSSKSLMPNTRLRSAEANTPKLATCISPQA